MNMNDLKPANQLAQQFGVKMLAFGGPGSGKTPLADSAPRPVILVTEPGMLSMRNSGAPCFEAYTVPKIHEFFEWFHKSSESKNFDTLCCDSLSQMAEMVLELELSRNKDGRKAYGEMSRTVYKIVSDLYYMQSKHMYLICKQASVEENGTSNYKKPYFPGNDLNVKIPHLFDLIAHIGLATVPGLPQPVRAIRCNPTYDILARDRGGRLDPLEQPNLTALFQKAMS